MTEFKISRPEKAKQRTHKAYLLEEGGTKTLVDDLNAILKATEGEIFHLDLQSKVVIINGFHDTSKVVIINGFHDTTED